MRELSKEVKRQIESIFDVNLSNDSPSFDFSVKRTIMRLKSELISYCERQSSTVIMINRYDQSNQWVSTLSFKTHNTDVIDQAKQLEVIISPLWDGFDIYEMYKIGPKKLIYPFKLK